MEDSARHPVSRSALPIAVAIAALLTASCAGLHPGPRALVTIGGVAIAGGTGMWATGEGLIGDSKPAATDAMVNIGFVGVVLGLAAIVVAGGWMAASVACQADPDCPEEEQCREVPAPPGGIPYKQCIPR